MMKLLGTAVAAVLFVAAMSGAAFAQNSAAGAQGVGVGNAGASAITNLTERGGNIPHQTPTVFTSPLVAGVNACLGSISGGGAGGLFGVSFGMTTTDRDCQDRNWVSGDLALYHTVADPVLKEKILQMIFAIQCSANDGRYRQIGEAVGLCPKSATPVAQAPATPVAAVPAPLPRQARAAGGGNDLAAAMFPQEVPQEHNRRLTELARTYGHYQ